MASDNVQTFGGNNFEQEVLQSDLPVLIDFWAPWCAPCKAIAPSVEQLADQYQGKVKIGKLNIDENREVAQRYGVMSIPTLLMFKGGQPVDQVVGAVPKASLEAMVQRQL